MKKLLFSFYLLLLSFFANSQNLKTFVSVGPSTYISDNTPELEWRPVVIYGVEFYETFGIEYGYSFKFNNSIKDFDNYVNGLTNEYESGRVTRLYSVYYKPKRNPLKLGVGVANTFIAKAVNTDLKLNNEFHPFVTFGLDDQINDLLGVSINMSLGNFHMITFGLSVNIR